MTDEEIRNQYRFTHHALVELYKLCKTLGNFKNGVEYNGIDEGDVYASGVFDRVETALRMQADVGDPSYERLREAIETVASTFENDQEQGFRTKDKEFAITILRAALRGML